MVVTPAPTPVTTPVDEPMVATEVLLLLQVPPGVTSARVMVEPAQTAEGPVIVAGNGLTVSTAVLIQPVAVSV